MSLPPEESTQWKTLNEVYLLSELDISSFSMTRYIDFQTCHFADFEQLKIDSQNSGQVKIDLFLSLLLTQGSPLTLGPNHSGIAPQN